MSKPSIYVTRKLPQKALDMLEKECEIKVNPYDRAMTRVELEIAIKGIDGLLCLLTDTIDSSLLELNPDLKVIANYAVGFDNIDIKACTERNIPVSNTPGILTDTTADLAWALIMATCRRVTEADNFVRKGKYRGWGPMMFLGGDVYGKTLGIIGMGRIGQSVVRRATGFDMDVIYYDAERKDEETERELGVEFRDFEEILCESDIISLHLPLNPGTRKLIGEKEFNKMKDTSYLINTSRGAVIDEKALVLALENGDISGAGLDVFEDEPKLTPGLTELDNVVLLPHIGSASIETRTKMAVLAAENIIAGVKGKIEEMPTLINKEVIK